MLLCVIETPVQPRGDISAVSSSVLSHVSSSGRSWHCLGAEAAGSFDFTARGTSKNLGTFCPRVLLMSLWGDTLTLWLGWTIKRVCVVRTSFEVSVLASDCPISKIQSRVGFRLSSISALQATTWLDSIRISLIENNPYWTGLSDSRHMLD